MSRKIFFNGKNCLCFCILIMGVTIARSQKPAIEFTTTFPSPPVGKISNDGKYVSYLIEDTKENKSELYIESVNGSFKKTITYTDNPNIDNIVNFTADSRMAIFIKPRDTLCMLNVISKEETLIPNCSSFQIPAEKNKDWVIYQLSSKEVIAYNLASHLKITYEKANGFLLSESGKVLLVNRESDDSKENILQWLDLSSGNTRTIWYGANATNYVFDPAETQLAFISYEAKSSPAENKIWYYNDSMNRAALIVDDNNIGIYKGFAVKNFGLKFGPDGKQLFFNLYNLPISYRQNESAVKVDVWNYKDEYTQHEQLYRAQFPDNSTYLAVVHLSNFKVVQLEKQNDGSNGRVRANDFNNGRFIVTSTRVDVSNRDYFNKSRDYLYLIKTSDGSRKLLKHPIEAGEGRFSPSGQYVYWYDSEVGAYFTYNLKTGRTRNITLNIPFPIYQTENYTSKRVNYDIAAWIENDEAILIYEKYDIWIADPNGIKAPRNLTNGYGRRNNLMLRLIYLDSRFNKPSLKQDTTVILAALNLKTKRSGFFTINLDHSADPVQLTMTSELFYFPYNLSFVSLPSYLIKARNSNVFLLTRMSATEFPNLCVTQDFTKFQQLTKLNPQKNFNWLTTELVAWKTFKGRPAQGILYKPEDFDAKKKYPIIFSLYEHISEGLNKFIPPELSVGAINIPFYVSNGYLVFCPDIEYTIGDPGGSAVDYVVSAAQFMSKKTFVDSGKMGMQGHSFGAFEANYILTQTNIFAAAASAAGVSSVLNSLDDPAEYQYAQYRFGKNLWQLKENYFKNSATLYLDKVNTPLLIMHNELDPLVPFVHALQLYGGLSWLGKPVWMLQYDGEYHIIGTYTPEGKKNAIDYSIRMHQFFDHYLKGTPAPIWMTQGIPATLKGIESGLALDTAGKCHKACKICRKIDKGKGKEDVSYDKE